MAIIAIVMSVNLAACSDDDEDIDTAQLEGNWGLVLDEGYYYEDGQKESWSDSYDPSNPTEDCERIVISKTGSNTYSVVNYYYYDGEWRQSDTDKFTLDGTRLFPVDADAEVGSAEIITANSSELVIEMKGVDEDGDYYNKMTYKRL